MDRTNDRIAKAKTKFDSKSVDDLLVSLPGWEKSAGATLERTVAEACGIEVCELAEAEE